MTGRELFNKLGELDNNGNIDISVCINHLKLNISKVSFDTSTDGKVPYINIQEACNHHQLDSL